MVNTGPLTTKIADNSSQPAEFSRPIRSWAALSMLLVACSAFGCDQQAPSGALTIAAPPTPTPAMEALEAEAVKAANKRFEEAWTRRGEWWYSIRGASTNMPRVVGLRGISSAVHDLVPVAGAENTNIGQWEGSVVFEAETTRQALLSEVHEAPGGKWQEWKPVPGEGVAYRVTSKDGVWEAENLDDYRKPPADAAYLK